MSNKELLRLLQSAGLYLYPCMNRGPNCEQWINLMKNIGAALDWKRCDCEIGCEKCYFTGYFFSLRDF